MRKFRSYVDLVLFNVRAQLQADSVHYYAGYLWLVLEPLLSALVYFLVFKVLLHHGEPNYIQFLFIGVLSWKWFAACVQNGSGSIYANKAFYKKIYIHKIIFPWIEVVYATVRFTIVLAFILAIYLITGQPLTINYLYLPILILCQFVFSLGLATLLAAFLPYFKDLQILIAFALRLGFYPSGVIFNLKRIPARYSFIVDYNPMAQAIHSFRAIVVDGKPPEWQGMVLMTSLGLLLYAVGASVIQYMDQEYAKIT